MVRAENRVSDVIWDSFNRLHDAKLSGSLKSTELASLIEKVGSVFANTIKKGKVSEEGIEDFEKELISENVFTIKHDNLANATKAIQEENDFAMQELEQKQEYAKPVLDAGSYEKTFRKLGH